MESDTEYSEYRTDVSETDNTSSARPGRFKGPKSTWRTFNEDEIILADSMVQLGAEDLSAHLYNAHERWRPAATLDDDGKNFVPPERWTAWPLEPEIVPRGVETRADERFTLKRVEVERPSRELEEILTGLVIKFAKDKFNEREWESEEESQGREEEGSGNAQQGDHEVLKDADIHPSDSEALTYPSPALPSSSKPIISSDDDRSARLLRPTIRHTLTHLDTLLTALQISRRACLRPERSPSPSDDPPIDPDQRSPSAIASPKRPRGRPRRTVDHAPAPLPPSPPKKSTRGRKKKIHVPLLGETHAEMLIRVAREQHRPIPFAADSAGKRSTSQSQSRSRSRSSSRGSRARLGVRDWSEVIGAAALAGWPGEVVQRAGRRCANLFGEGMGVRVLNEGAMGGEVREEMYLPEEIPDLGELSEEVHESVDMPVQSRLRSARAQVKARSRSRSRGSRTGRDEKTDISQFGVYAAYCPLRECERHERGFNSEKAVREHLMLRHEMGSEEMDALDGEQEMLGGVHRDGFGVMVKRRKGWRAGDAGVRRGRKKSGNDEDDSADAMEETKTELESVGLSD